MKVYSMRIILVLKEKSSVNLCVTKKKFHRVPQRIKTQSDTEEKKRGAPL